MRRSFDRKERTPFNFMWDFVRFCEILNRLADFDHEKIQYSVICRAKGEIRLAILWYAIWNPVFKSHEIIFMIHIPNVQEADHAGDFVRGVVLHKHHSGALEAEGFSASLREPLLKTSTAFSYFLWEIRKMNAQTDFKRTYAAPEDSWISELSVKI